MAGSTSQMLQINLIRNKKVFLDTFLRWALTTGRLIIIITETVALGAFAMRFSLDAQIIDLHDKIRSQQAIVDLLKHQEASYRNTQERLALIQQTSTQAQAEAKNFFSLLNNIPTTVTLNRFSFTPDTIHIEIDASSTDALNNFILQFKAQPQVDAISIDKIANNISEGKINVTLTANIKKT